MKKILILFGVFSLISAPAILVVACNIGSLDGSDYLNCLPNFDWTNSDYGDGIILKSKLFSSNFIILRQIWILLTTSVRSQYFL